jgi:hypothetical protein
VVFNGICILGILTTGLFGLAFLLAPEATLQLYGVGGLNLGTIAVARLFGVELLASTAVLAAVRVTPDALLQRRIATAFAAASAVGVAVTAHAAVIGAANVVMWSTVGIYVFFTVAWTLFATRRLPVGGADHHRTGPGRHPASGAEARLQARSNPPSQ